MTDLTIRATRLRFRTVCEVKQRGKYRKIVVEAKPDYALVRLEGMRFAYTIPWDFVWSLGAKISARNAAAEKLAKRKAKVGSR